MFGTDVALIILLALAFGFVNGWILNRQIVGGSTVAHEPPPFSLKADDLIPADDPNAEVDEIRVYPEEGLADEIPSGLGPFDVDESHLSEEERRIRTTRIRSLESRLREAEAEAGRYRTESRNLEARIDLLEPLVGQLRERDERISDLHRKHQDAVESKVAEVSRGEGRIADLEEAVRALHSRLEQFEAESASDDERREEEARAAEALERERKSRDGRNGASFRRRGFRPGDEDSQSASVPFADDGLEQELRARIAERDAEVIRLRRVVEDMRRGVDVARAAILGS